MRDEFLCIPDGVECTDADVSAVSDQAEPRSHPKQIPNPQAKQRCHARNSKRQQAANHRPGPDFDQRVWIGLYISAGDDRGVPNHPPHAATGADRADHVAALMNEHHRQP